MNSNLTLNQVVEELQKKIFQNLNVSKIGKVVTFYPDDKTADIEICYKRKINNKLVDYPVLQKMPVVCNHITYPVKSGEYCLVIFNDINIDRWFEEGQGEPYTEEKHQISDGFVIVGLNNLLNKIADYETDRIDLRENSVVSANFEVEEDTLLDGKLEVEKKTQLNDTLQVEKKTTLKDMLETQKDANFLMNVNISLNLVVSGNITCNNLTASAISCGGMSVSNAGIQMSKPINSSSSITATNITGELSSTNGRSGELKDSNNVTIAILKDGIVIG